jgi:hypothetical protein
MMYFDRPAPSSQWRTIGNREINFDDVRMHEVIGNEAESAVRIQYRNGDFLILHTGTAAECAKFSDQLRG